MVLTDIVATAIAVMAREPEADDHDLTQHLIAAGLAPAVAARMVVFLPMALAHRLLLDLGAAVPRIYEQADAAGNRVEHMLWEEPVYIEALAARLKDNDTFEAVAFRSAEMNAANKALLNGSNAADLEFSPTIIPREFLEPSAPPPSRVWWQVWRKASPPAVPEPEDELIATSTVELVREGPRTASELKRILEAHDLEVSIEGAVVRIASSGVAFEPVLYARGVRRGRVHLQLDVRATGGALGKRELCLSCSDWSDRFDAAVTKCLEKVQLGALHPLLAALVDRRFAEREARTEVWGGYIAYVGNQVQQYDVPADLDCVPVVNRVRDAWLASAPTRELHWLSLFVMVRVDGENTYEVLRDNQVWPPGEAILAAHPWPASTTFYTSRIFITLVPAQ
jgi:hypothetical protein